MQESARERKADSRRETGDKRAEGEHDLRENIAKAFLDLDRSTLQGKETSPVTVDPAGMVTAGWPSKAKEVV